MILEALQQRLYAGLVRDAGINCHPDAEARMLDLASLARWTGLEPHRMIAALFSGREIELLSGGQPASPEANGQDRERLVKDLRWLASEAWDHEQRAGRNILHIGFPLLGAPPTEERVAGAFFSFQSMAPVAFAPVELTVQGHGHPSVTLRLQDTANPLRPNLALLAWIEHHTGKQVWDLVDAESPADPYRKVNGLIRLIADVLEMPGIPEFGPETPFGPVPQIVGTRRHFFSAAVLGLFPWAQDGLLRDTRALAAGHSLRGPVLSFLQLDGSKEPATPGEPSAEHSARDFAEERFLTGADPFQARALRLVKHYPGLVIHGPPGSGKSQTVLNLIGDHLVAGEKVLVISPRRASREAIKAELDRLGLGDLAVVVHDAERMSESMRAHLSQRIATLAESKDMPPARLELELMDEEQRRLHEELEDYYRAVAAKSDAGQMSLQEMVGVWLSIDPPAGVHLEGVDLSAVRLPTLTSYRADLQEILGQGQTVGFASNPWCAIVGPQAREFLGRHPGALSGWATGLVQAALAADAALVEGSPPFAAEVDLVEQHRSRLALANRIEKLAAIASAEALARWAEVDYETVQRLQRELAALAPSIALFQQGPLDPALAPRAAASSSDEVDQFLAALREYEPLAGRWSRFFAFKERASAKRVTSRLGLGLSLADLRRAISFWESYQARLFLSAFFAQVFGTETEGRCWEEQTLAGALREAESIGELLQQVYSDPALVGLAESVRAVLAQRDLAPALVAALKSSQPRMEKLFALEAALDSGDLLVPEWRVEVKKQLRSGAVFHSVARALDRSSATVEEVVRIHSALAGLPEPLWRAAVQLLGQGTDPETGWQAVLKAVLQTEIGVHLRAQPSLSGIGMERMQSHFRRFAELDKEKQKLVRQQIAHYWQLRQWDRILGPTGNELNFRGLRLKERFPGPGGPVLDWRQTVRLGLDVTGGDALFDLCPVWVTSPEVAAQLFPLEAMFDLVVFDDASQCWLEEALPLLTRGKRVVILGDARQAPARRVEESAGGEGKASGASDDVFVQPLVAIESLMDAALGAELPQAYLGVHYTSRDERLFHFANRHFYGERLQPVPLHPSQRWGQSPIRMHRVDGICAGQANRKEAEQVCRVVQELLSRPETPSLGIACFSREQRDEIQKVLEAEAETDPQLAAYLNQTKGRGVAGNGEALFVRSLEQAAEDRRDHLIISTTFGPEATGKWKRRFGALAGPAGARWFNALTCRARLGVHLVTSIPRYEYGALPVLKPGQSPNGTWFLYAYLQYAETLEAAGEESQQPSRSETTDRAAVVVRESANPSALARALAEKLSAVHAVGSEVEWGNDGFCVDLALRHPERPGEIILGLLCDVARFEAGADAVGWDLFKTSLLEQQGWKLLRLWTPIFYRNPDQALETILGEIKRLLEEEKRQLPPSSANIA